jgi:hypothetical protein
LKNVFLYILIFLAGFADGLLAAEDFSDAPEYSQVSTAVSETLGSYEHALQAWKTPEDINAWIASNFSYDMNRSMRLSETQVTQQGQPTIYTPSEFFSIKSGTCVDLSRFAVETLKIINPQYDPKYLMIEFYPITIDGNMLRRHWLVSFKRDGQTYFFADSNRPGLVLGPFNAPEEFIREYERYRGRRIVAFRQMESYQKDHRVRTLKLKAPQKRR